MADIYRRCGCRRPDNTLFPGLPDRATAEQRAATCPALLKDSRHGSWGFAVSAGKDPRSGKRLQVRRMGYATKREAQRERAKTVGQVASGRYRSDPKLTVATWFPAWLDRRERDGLRPSTARMYRRYIEQDVVPALGNLKLADLRRHHVDRFVQDMSKAGRGATTVRRIHAVLSSGLSAAERLDLVTYNAASKIALPPVKRERTRVWEPEQVRVFLDVAAEHRLGPLYELAVLTGLRRGELTGLRWSDIDLARRELRVRQQRVDVGNRVIEGPVKTAAGQDRRVSLGGEAVSALVEWKQRQADERQLWDNKWVDTGYVFTRENGVRSDRTQSPRSSTGWWRRRASPICQSTACAISTRHCC